MTDLVLKQSSLLDRLEQGLIVLLWMWFTYRLLVANAPFWQLLVMSEALVVIFVLLRRPTTAISVNIWDWLLALTATAAPMLIEPSENTGFPAAGVMLILLGNMWQLSAKLFLRRSFGVAPANRGVKVDGPYRVMRHPIYSGYFATHVGTLLIIPSLWNFSVYLIAWILQICRLMAEEKYLSTDPVYVHYQNTVRYRLIPGVF
jgi:protein-S-isoprenylcysteine O-methyltransferase Ste14